MKRDSFSYNYQLFFLTSYSTKCLLLFCHLMALESTCHWNKKVTLASIPAAWLVTVQQLVTPYSPKLFTLKHITTSSISWASAVAESLQVRKSWASWWHSKSHSASIGTSQSERNGYMHARNQHRATGENKLHSSDATSPFMCKNITKTWKKIPSQPLEHCSLFTSPKKHGHQALFDAHNI